ncbi:MAG: hypothetical protein EZS28_047487 [Streblomastix strix]|uniref:Uncharacterized protein n=1 Tax=Streblomastix strix TaxID=222440 RepID=A0A5J4TFP0_9EUKA|nr:MAG: hypothetical protein EZS28_047487 [Streblomastix strix]
MGMRNTIATLSNLIDSSSHILSGTRVGERGIKSTNMEKICMMDSPNANHNTLERAGRQLKCFQGGNMDEEEQSETTSGED